MLSIVDDSAMSQLLTFPTRAQSIVDLLLTSHPDLVTNIRSTEGISDRSAVSFDLNMTVKINKKRPRSVYKFNKNNFNEVRMDASELSKTFFARNPTDHSVEDNWQFLKAGLIEILDKQVPEKKLGTWSDTPWITTDLKRLLRKKKRLYNIYKNTNNSDDKHKYRKFQKYLKVKLRKAQDDFIAVIEH